MSESNWAQLAEDYDLERHPDADKLIVRTTEPGQCICGEQIPPQEKWNDWPHQWSNWTCAVCGRCFVDEDEYIAIYDEGCDADEPIGEG